MNYKLLNQELPELTITKSMIAKKLEELDMNKSCGPDQMHSHLFKEMANKLSIPLSIIMNKSLQTKSLPRNWIKANIISQHC